MGYSRLRLTRTKGPLNLSPDCKYQFSSTSLVVANFFQCGTCPRSHWLGIKTPEIPMLSTIGGFVSKKIDTIVILRWYIFSQKEIYLSLVIHRLCFVNLPSSWNAFVARCSWCSHGYWRACTRLWRASEPVPTHVPLWRQVQQASAFLSQLSPCTQESFSWTILWHVFHIFVLFVDHCAA